MTRPLLAIVYQKGFPAEVFTDFVDSFPDKSLDVHLEEIPLQGPLAGMAWTMLTGGAVFIASSYFGGILKEVGKEHYELLKKWLAKLTEKTMETPGVEPTLIGTSGKLEKDDAFSMGFSIWAEIPGGAKIKFLIPKNGCASDYSKGTETFIEFLRSCHEDVEAALDGAGFKARLTRGMPITVAYNRHIEKIEWVDPLPESVRNSGFAVVDL
jgi:hypothetical protein